MTTPRVFAHHELAPLLGLRHDDEKFNCGHFLILVLQQLFHVQADLPQAHPRGRRGRAALLGRLSRELAQEVEAPVSGDVALYDQVDADGGLHFHVGAVLRQAGELWLLHLPEGGESVLQPETDAGRNGLRRVGFFRLNQEEISL